MTCLVVAVAVSGFMTCASASGPPLGILSPADTRQQYTIVETGKQGPGFCVAGTTLDAAEDINWDNVRSSLEAHAEACSDKSAPEQGVLSRIWHGYWDSTPSGEAEIAVDHRIEDVFKIVVTTNDGIEHDFAPGTSVDVMESTIAKYISNQNQREEYIRRQQVHP